MPQSLLLSSPYSSNLFHPKFPPSSASVRRGRRILEISTQRTESRHLFQHLCHTAAISCSSSSPMSPVEKEEDIPLQHQGKLSYARAHWVARSLIAWDVNVEDTICYLYASKSATLFLTEDGIEGHDMKIQVEQDIFGLPLKVIEKFPHIADYNAFKIPYSVDIKSLLKCQLAIASFSENGKCSDATGLQLPGVLDGLFSYSGPLGAVFTREAVSLYLWSPTAQAVCACIYRDPSGGDPLVKVQLDEANGVWSVNGPRSWEGCYYAYEVSIYHPGTLQIETCRVNDPYARGLSADGERTLLVNLDSDSLKPQGWDELADEKPDLPSFSDITIYELHIRDFSANDKTVNPEIRGGYLAFTCEDQETGKVMAKGPKCGRLFPLHISTPSPDMSLFASKIPSKNNVQLWHTRLGHPNSKVLLSLLNSGHINKMKFLASDVALDCTVCKLGKSKILPFPLHVSSATKCFDLIHSDVWGVAPVISHSQYKYFVTFIDDYSRFTWVYFLHAKSEVFDAFKRFLNYVQNQFSTCIKIFRTDSGGEYVSEKFQTFLQEKGIISQRTCPYTPQQNGIAERKNRHLLDMVRCLLLESSVPPRFWPEALTTATHIINRLPSPKLQNTSPYFRLFQNEPKHTHLHTFGCVCFVHLPTHERSKLSAQSAKCVFLGYASQQKGFVCYDPKVHRIRISRNVVFFEHMYFFQSIPDSLSAITFSKVPSFDDECLPSPMRFHPDKVYARRQGTNATNLPLLPAQAPDPAPAPDPPQSILRRSSRITRPPDRYGFSHSSYLTTLSSVSIPNSYSQAAKQDCWRQAMEEELNALQQNHTWDVVPCPSSVKPIGCKWVFSIKLKADGSLDRYKARLVALGNRQEYGIDYEETFAPVAKMTSVRTILAIAASQSWPLFQFDVKNAFLHGDLKEDVYMRLPHGFPISSDGQVARLKRSLYGLKQAPRAWFDKFKDALLKLQFQQSPYDPSMFLHQRSSGITILLVYVDDIIITGTDTVMIKDLQTSLHQSFQMKDLGPLTYFLGLEVQHSAKGLILHQHKYTMDLIESAGLSKSTPVDTPLEVNLKLHSESGDPLPDPTYYRQLVGSLIYLTNTRPDISYAVNLMSQYMTKPYHLHLAAVRRIIRYLIGTPHRGLFFPVGSTMTLTAYSDADWAGCPDTRRSTTGWCMYLGDALISWKVKKQDKVSRSSTEAEYRAMSKACSEILWLRGLLTDLGFTQRSPTPLHADNTSAIRITENPVFHERTKHIEVACHFIRDEYLRNVISLPFISSGLQIADIFTKALPRPRHQFLTDKLMLVDSPASI